MNLCEEIGKRKVYYRERLDKEPGSLFKNNTPYKE